MSASAAKTPTSAGAASPAGVPDPTRGRLPVFSRGALVGLIVVGVGSLVAALLFGVYGEPEPVTPDANVFSRSAIGHRALINLLDQNDVPYLVSRWRSGARAADGGVLVVIEPDGIGKDPTALYEADGPNEQAEQLAGMVKRADRSLVVLPKWRGMPDPENPRHLEWVEQIGPTEAPAILEALHVGGFVTVHESRDVDFYGPADFPVSPQVESLQVIRGMNLDPIVSTDRGIWLGRLQRGDADIFVLADPDVLQTHGLVRGDNAEIALAVLDYVRDGRTLIIDETLHGFEQRPSLSREMMSFPLVLAVGQVLLVVGLLIWTGAMRFGGPRKDIEFAPNGDDVDTAGGVRGLIDSTAALLSRSLHGGNTVSRYFVMAVREVARSLDAPRVRSQDELIEWLVEAGEARDVDIDLEVLREDVRLMSLERKVDQVEAVALTRRVFAWKQAMLG